MYSFGQVRNPTGLFRSVRFLAGPAVGTSAVVVMTTFSSSCLRALATAAGKTRLEVDRQPKHASERCGRRDTAGLARIGGGAAAAGCEGFETSGGWPSTER